MTKTDNQKKPIPVAPLKIVYLKGSQEMAKAVDNNIVKSRKSLMAHRSDVESIPGYVEPSYLVNTNYFRYGTG